MGCLCGGGEEVTNENSSGNYSSSSTNNSSFSRSSRPHVPGSWQSRYDSTMGNYGTYGQTPNQGAAGAKIRSLLESGDIEGALAGAGGDIASGMRTFQDGLSYLRGNQNIGSNTLGKWFPNAPSVTSAQTADPNSVQARTAADFAGGYGSLLNDAYVDPALADYDAGVGKGYNAFRAQNAGAFGNKRLGVAESEFMDTAARGRGALSAQLRRDAAMSGLGYAAGDADRATGASSANAANKLTSDLANAEREMAARLWNADNTQRRQEFDIGQADIGDERRLGISRDIMSAGTQMPQFGQMSLDNILRGMGGLSGLAGDSANLDNMTMGQLLSFLGLGTETFGGDETGTGTESGTESGTETSTGTTRGRRPGNLFGTLSGLALASGRNGLNLWK